MGTTKATELGHFDQERLNLQSTQQQDDEEEDFFPSKIAKKTYGLFAKVSAAAPKEKAYTYQTGRFPHKSTRGNERLFTLYDYDANIILQYPLKSRQGKEIADAFHATFLKLTKYGHATKLFILDNEYFNGLKLAILNTNSTFELVPPHHHRRNAAERAIRTAKNHLLARLATYDPDFLLQNKIDC